PALKPLALRMVWDLARAVKIPIVGIGGISNAEDAIEFMLAGATAIQVGTASFADPTASKKILDGLAAFCAERKIAARDLIGKLQTAWSQRWGTPVGRLLEGMGTRLTPGGGRRVCTILSGATRSGVNSVRALSSTDLRKTSLVFFSA